MDIIKQKKCLKRLKTILKTTKKTNKIMKEKRMCTLISPKSGFSQLISKKIKRNDLCPCGSGKKAKKCCGAETKYYSK